VKCFKRKYRPSIISEGPGPAVPYVCPSNSNRADKIVQNNKMLV